MNILWLPHSPLRLGRTRSDHLIERLAQHHRIAVLSFHVHPTNRSWRYLTDIFTHRTRRGPPYDELPLWRVPKTSALNGAVLNRVIARELAHRHYDVLVVAPAPYLTGYLDFAALKGRVPMVCDYLDGTDWSQDAGQSAFEPLYVKSADAVICVSRGLLRQALSVNHRSFYVPNGVELARYRAFRATHTARECKIALGIDPAAYVVSIIGMTCSPRLYFVEGLARLADKGRNIVLLLVGESPLLPEILRRAGNYRGKVHAVGGVPYGDVLPYFMATDLGLSAVDDHPYYHFQSPLKVFEYGAMGKPVLAAPRVEEIAEMHLSHVRFCDADPQAFERAVEQIISAHEPFIEPDLVEYDWDRLTDKVEGILTYAASGLASSARR